MIHKQAHEFLVLITYATSKYSVEPAHPPSVHRAFPARIHKIETLTNAQTKFQVSSPT